MGEEPENSCNAPQFSSPDLTSFDALDATLMRGIPLRQTLQWGAHLWLSDPRSMRAFQKARLWDASKPTKRYDKFISHTWETHGRWKQLSLLLHFGWPSMMIFGPSGQWIASVSCTTRGVAALHCLSTAVAGYMAWHTWHFRPIWLLGSRDIPVLLVLLGFMLVSSQPLLPKPSTEVAG